MASRYVSTRYGSARLSEERGVSQVRETSRTNYRSMSVSPFLSASQYTDSTYCRRDTASLLQQYQPVRGRYSYSQDRERARERQTPVSYTQKTELRASNIRILQTSGWRRYQGRGAQWTSQFLGTERQRDTRLSTPTFEPPRVFIYHKSTVN